MSSKTLCLAAATAVAIMQSTATATLAETPAIDRFEAEISSYEKKADSKHDVANATVFVGSSTFTRWESLEQDLKDLKAINRGFGGSTIPEVNFYEKRLLKHLSPGRIVFYAGTNDLAEGHSPDQVLADFKKFVSAVRRDYRDIPIYFVSMSVAPSRLGLEKQFDESNDLVSKYIKSASDLHFIDVRSVMRDRSKHLRAEFFGPDDLHMTRAGYEAWMPILRREILKYSPELASTRTVPQSQKSGN